MTATITKIQPFVKTGKDLLGSGYGSLEKNAAARSLGNGIYEVVLDYSFTRDGAIAASSGTKNLLDLNGNAFVFPTGSQVVDVQARITETFVSATDAMTISLGFLVDDVAGIKAATAISAVGDYWDTTAKVKACIQDGTPANAAEALTAERSLVITNTHASETNTAGALKLLVKYVDLN